MRPVSCLCSRLFDLRPRHPRLSAMAVALTAAAAFAPLAPNADAKTVRARQASEFYRSIGVNTAFAFDGVNYETNFNYLRNALVDLRPHFIRDHVFNSADRDYHARLYEASGNKLKFLIISQMKGGDGRLDAGRIDQQLNILETMSGSLLGIEGPNEYDLFRPAIENDWAGRVRNYQTQLYNKVQNRAKLRNLPVVSPSWVIGRNTAAQLGDLSSKMDAVAVHRYEAHPEDDWGRWNRDADKVGPRRDRWITEFGWRTAGSSRVVNDKMQSRYLLRGFA